MKIAELAKEPQLIELTLDSEELVSKYGEPITVNIFAAFTKNVKC